MTAVKKDGTVRVCLDARKLNSVMVSDNELPLPIDSIVRDLGNVRYMSSLELTSSYWQIPIKPDHRQFTGFRHGTRTYQFKVLPFGLKTAVASFTRCMDQVLGPFFAAFVHVYVDDILITSSSFQEHVRHLDLVLARLAEAGFTIRRNKCSFFREEIDFLGYVLNTTGLRPHPNRAEAISEFPIPKNISQLQAFLGLCNFDRTFVENFASTTEPLTALLRKGAKWVWADLQQQAFEALKKLLTRETLLYHPNYAVPFIVQCDASDVGLGAVLYQNQNGMRRVVAYASRLLLDRERRYATHEKELLSIVFALQKWRVHLLGHHFTILTDHKILAYVNSCRLLSARITRWVLALQEFDFEIQYISGKDNLVQGYIISLPFPTP